MGGLLGEKKEVMECLNKTSAAYETAINAEKTKVMTNNRDQKSTGRGLKQQQDSSTWNKFSQTVVLELRLISKIA